MPSRASQPNLVALADALFLILFLYALGEIAKKPQMRMDEPPGLSLPSVAGGQLDTLRDTSRLIVCITRDGTLFVAGEERSDRWVRDALAIEARLSRSFDTDWSDRVVMIRADERAAFRHVRKILDWCREEEIRIWRLEFGVRAIEPDAQE